MAGIRPETGVLGLAVDYLADRLEGTEEGFWKIIVLENIESEIK